MTAPALTPAVLCPFCDVRLKENRTHRHFYTCKNTVCCIYNLVMSISVLAKLEKGVEAIKADTLASCRAALDAAPEPKP